MPKPLRTTLAKLIDGTPLAGWLIDAEFQVPTSPDSAAEITVERETREAKIVIHPNWSDMTIWSLRQLLAHELGHCLTEDVFRLLQHATPQGIAEGEEIIATRIGQLLLRT